MLQHNNYNVIQTNLFEVHRFENTVENQIQLDEGRKDFSNQCKKLFIALLNGNRITFQDAMNNYGISDIRRRAKDLVDDNGVMLSKVKVKNSRIKEWFMTSEQIEENKKLYLYNKLINSI